LKDRDLGTYGFLGYPLLQSADIVIYDADFVPVGEDQVPHVEITREIVRRFNFLNAWVVSIDELCRDANYTLARELYKFLWSHLTIVPQDAGFPPRPIPRETAKFIARMVPKVAEQIGVENFIAVNSEWKKFAKFEPVLSEPGHLLTETPRLPGTDGRRMAKSYGNAIWLSDSPDEIRAKVRNMMTDPQRQRRTDPGRPEVCPVFAYHKLFSPADTIAQVDRDCRTAAIGCVDCKKLMAENLVKWIEPVQERRKEFETHPQVVWDILDAGGKKAQAAARRTMKRVRNAIFKWDEARK